MAGLLGPGLNRQFPQISAAALKAGEENIAKGVPTKAVLSAPEPAGKNFVRIPFGFKGGRGKFDRCVKKVRRTVKARRGSNKESAAIAICTTSVLHPRGRTLKSYRKGRLTTQKKFNG
jgi:hypothetical protein